MANMTDLFNGMIGFATDAGKAAWGAVPSVGELMNVDEGTAGNFSIDTAPGYDNPELTIGGAYDAAVEGLDGYQPNPYGFPQASLNESNRTQPLAANMVGNAAEGIGDAVVGAAYAVPDAISGGFEATGEAFGNAMEQEITVPEIGGSPAIVPTNTGKVNPANKQEVFDMVEYENKTRAEHMGRVAKQKATDIEANGTEQQKESLWKMVKDATLEVGSDGLGALKDGFDLSYKAWSDLAPSTRMALVGTAATAFAYSKGWKKTAGDVALTSASMYSGMYGQETAAQGAVDVENSKNLGKAADAKLSAKDPNKWQQHDYERVNKHFSDLVAKKYSGWMGFGKDPAGQAKQANQLAAAYKQHLVVNGMPSDAFTPENYIDMLKAQDAERARRVEATHTTPGTASWLK